MYTLTRQAVWMLRGKTSAAAAPSLPAEAAKTSEISLAVFCGDTIELAKIYMEM